MDFLGNVEFIKTLLQQGQAHWVWVWATSALKYVLDWGWLPAVLVTLVLSKNDAARFVRDLRKTGEEGTTEGATELRQKPTFTDAVGLRDEVIVELIEPPTLDQHRAPISVSQHDHWGWNVFYENRGADTLINFRLVIRACEKWSPLDKRYAVGWMEEMLAHRKSFTGMDHGEYRALIRYEHTHGQMLVGNAKITSLNEGIWRIKIEVSADGYLPRTDAYCFKWKPKEQAVQVDDPLGIAAS